MIAKMTIEPTFESIAKDTQGSIKEELEDAIAKEVRSQKRNKSIS